MATMDHIDTRISRLLGVRYPIVERASRPGTSPAIVSALVASANETIDLDELRMASLENYVPAPIILLLVGVASVALAFFGWSFGTAERRSTGSMLLLAVLIAAVLTMTMDINRPHRGIVRVGDSSLRRLQKKIGSPGPP